MENRASARFGQILKGGARKQLSFRSVYALRVHSAKTARLALMAKNATNVRVGSTAFHLVNHANATQVDQEMVTSVMPKLVNVIASQGSQVITAPNVD